MRVSVFIKLRHQTYARSFVEDVRVVESGREDPLLTELSDQWVEVAGLRVEDELVAIRTKGK